MIDNLIKFAKEHHAEFAKLEDGVIKDIFLLYKDTTKIRQNEKGEITGFCIWSDMPGKIVFVAIAGIGSRAENYKVMRKHLRQFNKPIFMRNNSFRNIFKCLRK